MNGPISHVSDLIHCGAGWKQPGGTTFARQKIVGQDGILPHMGFPQPQPVFPATCLEAPLEGHSPCA
jgi:hypothetical protein